MRKIILALFSLVFLTCEVVNIDYLKPIMITNEPSSVLTNSAILGGRVLGEGGQDITEYGLVFSETFPPTIADNKIIEGERIGAFAKRYEDLKSHSTYYCSAYGINETGVGYGQIYEFTTNSEPVCNPVNNNFINLGQSSIPINDVVYKNPSGFNDGNVQFQTRTSSSTLYITLQFNELNADLPLTGEYITVSTFDNQSIRSNREVKLDITDFGFGSLGGAYAGAGEKIYLENNGANTINFIFCDVEVNSNYTLNGKYTYIP
ncbi:hypothetical protein [Algibacter sp. 2305UL17-15]|uniref:hypothetical protein n=1 Tax=Algibacter sp. 2305UL17-15 TaxID=3231268 RepID=UPI00345B3D69